MNQTEIDELRERIDAAISTVCNGMAAMSIPADPRDVDLVLADCAKALAALEEARAERYTLKEKLAAMDLLLNNAERVVRDGIADRDAAETQAWDALGRPDGTHDTSNVQRLCEAHIALKAKLASKGACDIAAERSRQMEKWGNDHDDEHSGGALAYRAAELAAAHTHLRVFASPPDLWGLLEKHRETRQRLVIAGALVAAEIDRLDRAAIAAAKEPPCAT